MSILSSKWFLLLALLLVIIVVLALTGHKRVHTKLHINAAPEVIWSALMDTDAYSKWNSFIPKIEGRYALDAKITNHTVMPGASKPSAMKTKVIAFEENKLLHQRGSIPGVISFDHKYRLIPQDDGTTLLIQEEDYKGIYVWFWDAQVMVPVYSKVNQELANYIN